MAALLHIEDPLIKSAPLKFGSWGGMPIIGVGPKGGKIVGYKSNGKPIYAGSSEAKKLTIQRKAHTGVTGSSAAQMLAWLIDIGIPAKVSAKGSFMAVSPASAKLLESQFGVKSKTTASGTFFKVSDLKDHIGKPLTPTTSSETAHFQAKAASGELDKDPFPDLSTLKHVKVLKSGQHQVDLYKDGNGKKWVFKSKDEKISRAEEASVRISRLILGSKRAAAAKHVTVGGQPGVLIEFLEGEILNDSSHSNPPQEVLLKYAADVMKHQVVDWIVSNHDSHAGNFLVTPDGKAMGGIDKGQAWKFLGKDKLDADYQPNASKQIYLPFWKRWAQGQMKGISPGYMIKAAGEALDEAEKITKEQFESITAPYIAIRVQSGANGEKLKKKMWSRLQNARGDFQNFLSERFGHQVVIPKKGADNFETMPETEAKPKKEKAPKEQLTQETMLDYFKEHPTHKISPAELAYAFEVSSQKASQFLIGMYKDGLIGRKLYKHGYVYFPIVKPEAAVVEPSKPAVIEGGAKAPVADTKPAPGWPITKGKTTIHHPGEPAPADVSWYKGYPGPGFKVALTYKKKDYVVEFELTANNNPTVKVYFPDGTPQSFASPNAASDALVLFEKGLPLDMTATEKKAKGISYPAKTAFGVNKFKAELAQAKTVPVEELEEATQPIMSDETAASILAGTYHDAPAPSQAELDAAPVNSTVALTMPSGTVATYTKWTAAPGAKWVSDDAGDLSSAQMLEVGTNVALTAAELTTPPGEPGWKPMRKPESVAYAKEFLDKQPVGTKIGYSYSFSGPAYPAVTKKEYIATKTDEDGWQEAEVNDPDDTSILVEVDLVAEKASDHKILKPGGVVPEKPSESNWDTFEEYADKATVGAMISFYDVADDENYYAVLSEDIWLVYNSEGSLFYEKSTANLMTHIQLNSEFDSLAFLYPFEVEGAKKTGSVPDAIPTISPEKLEPGPGKPVQNLAELAQAPKGSTVTYGYMVGNTKPTKYTLTKKANGKWAHVTTGSEETNLDVWENHDADVTQLMLDQPEPAPQVDTKAAKIDVPKGAKPTTGSPFPPGSSKTVQKKFPWGKSQVLLSVSDSGSFSAGIMKPDGTLVAEDFKSLSMASDWIWVQQKGYDSIEDYKAKTDKNKVPSGGGWKFWGIDPKAIVAPPIPEEAAPVVPLTKNPTVDQLVQALHSGTFKLGDVFTFETPSGKIYDVSRDITGGFRYHDVEKPPGFEFWMSEEETLSDLHGNVKAGSLLGYTPKDQVAPESVVPAVVPFDQVPGDWASSPSQIETAKNKVEYIDNLDNAPIGTKIKWITTGGQHGYKIATKTTVGWDIVRSTSPNPVKRSSDWVADATWDNDTVQGITPLPSSKVYAGPTAIKANVVDKLDDFPVGTVVNYTDEEDNATYDVKLLGGGQVTFKNVTDPNYSELSVSMPILVTGITTDLKPNTSVTVKLPAPTSPATTTPSDENWATMPDNWIMGQGSKHLNGLPAGAQIKYWDPDWQKDTTVTKQADGSWELKSDDGKNEGAGAFTVAEMIPNLLASINDGFKIQKMDPPPTIETKSLQVHTAPTAEKLKAWPIGTKFGWDVGVSSGTDKVSFEKFEDGWRITTDGMTSGPYYTDEQTKKKVNEWWNHEDGNTFLEVPETPPGKWAPLFPGAVNELTVKDYPVGTKIKYLFASSGGAKSVYSVEHIEAQYEDPETGEWTGEDQWIETNENSGDSYTTDALTIVSDLKKLQVSAQKIMLPELAPTTAPALEPGWETFEGYGENKAAAVQKLKDAPVGSQIKFAKSGGFDWIMNKTGADLWKDPEGTGVDTSNGVMSYLDEDDIASIKYPDVPTPAAPAPKPSKYGTAKIANLNPAALPDVVAQKINQYEAEAQGYNSEMIKKSPKWPKWVPPMGTWIESTIGDKKYWLGNGVAGFTASGEPHPKFNLALMDEEGQFYVSGKYQKGPAALNKVLINAGLSVSYAQAKEMFNLDGLVFAAGESVTTIKAGTGPSALDTHTHDKHPVDMTEAEKKAQVKVALSVAEAIKDKFAGTFKVDASDLSKVLYTVDPGGLSAFTDLLDGLGVKNYNAKKSHPGWAFTIPMEELAKEVVVAASGATAASSPPTVSADNWDTMPEGVPKILDHTTSALQLQNQLNAMPVGTKCIIYGKTNEPALTWEKTGQSAFTSPPSGAVWTNGNLIHSVKLAGPKGHKYQVVPPGADAPPPPPKSKKAKPKAKPKKKNPAKTKENAAKLKLAKETATWVKAHPAVGDSEIRLALAHFQKRKEEIGFEGKVWARMEGENVIIGGDDPKFEDFMNAAFGGKLTAVDKTPIPDAKFFSFTKGELQSTFPEATTIIGPDSKPYPQGTKFTKKTIKTTVEDLVKEVVTNIKEHKKDPDTKVMLKIGSEGDAAEKLQKLLDDYAIETDETIKTGASYTMVGVPKSELAKIGKTEVQITPKVPPQLPPFKPSTLPLLGGVQRDGEPAVVNRNDLATLDSIKIPPLGHWIRCGKFGVFDGNQLRVMKVRDKDGKETYEIYGQPQHPGNIAPKISTGSHQFYKAEFNGVSHQYDAENGVIEKAASSGASFPGWNGSTDDGSTIQMMSGKGGFNKYFRISIDADKDVESELADAFGKLGFNVDDAMVEPDDNDERLLIKHSVLRSYTGASVYGAGMGVMTEAELDSALAKKKAKTAAANATIEIANSGKHVVMVDDLDNAKDKGVEFVYAARSGVKSVVNRILGNDLGSNRTKLSIGAGTAGAGSFDADKNTGGINATFCRLGNKNGSGWGNINSGAGCPKMLFHPRVLKRTDWWAHPSDSFGEVGSGGDSRSTAMGYKAGTNEINFEDGIALRHLAGVLVHSQSQKNDMKKQLTEAGKTSINGISLDDFIVVHGTGTSKGTIANSAIGLKEGVLS